MPSSRQDDPRDSGESRSPPRECQRWDLKARVEMGAKADGVLVSWAHPAITERQPVPGLQSEGDVLLPECPFSVSKASGSVSGKG